MICLPNTGPEAAGLVLGRTREEIGVTRVDIGGAETLAVKVSGGGALATV